MRSSRSAAGPGAAGATSASMAVVAGFVAGAWDVFWVSMRAALLAGCGGARRRVRVVGRSAEYISGPERTPRPTLDLCRQLLICALCAPSARWAGREGRLGADRPWNGLPSHESRDQTDEIDSTEA